MTVRPALTLDDFQNCQFDCPNGRRGVWNLHSAMEALDFQTEFFSSYFPKL